MGRGSCSSSCSRVSSDRQDIDLSVAAQLRALREHAEKNNYLVVREYVDEAESGRVADRPHFRRMLDEAGESGAPFEEVLVWKFSRFTRKREHAVAFKSMLRRRGIRVGRDRRNGSPLRCVRGDARPVAWQVQDMGPNRELPLVILLSGKLLRA